MIELPINYTIFNRKKQGVRRFVLDVRGGATLFCHSEGEAFDKNEKDRSAISF